LSGNPQNILIGSFSGISYLEFLRALIPVALIGLIIQIGLLWLLYPDVRSRSVPQVSLQACDNFITTKEMNYALPKTLVET
jgi:Na+/H+ antiporter NhaD/arsenite permease-like protein